MTAGAGVDGDGEGGFLRGCWITSCGESGCEVDGMGVVEDTAETL